MNITKDILIEDLVSKAPESVQYLMEKGIRPLACGEPVWGTLEQLALDQGFTGSDIAQFVKDLSTLHCSVPS